MSVQEETPYTEVSASGLDNEGIPASRGKVAWSCCAIYLLGAVSATVLGVVVANFEFNDSSSSSSPTCSYRGIFESDTQLCECFPCVSGDNCEIFDADSCIVDASLAQPYLFEEFWMNFTRDHNPSPLYDSEYTYRVPYDIGGPLPPDSRNLSKFDQMLNNAIRNVHEIWQNAETNGYTIVYGNGAQHLITAAIIALASRENETVHVFEQPPYNPSHSAMLLPTSKPFVVQSGYPLAIPIINPTAADWSNSLDLDPKTVIELVTIPNNPDGYLRSPYYSTGNRIYDLAMYWPHLCNITEKYSQEIMIFSMSKLTGHASIRFGWALVKDPDVASAMWDYITRNNLWISSGSRRHATALLNTMNTTGGELVNTITDVMYSRWNAILNLLNGNQTRFYLAGAPYSTFLYLYLRYDDEKNATASQALFASVGIIGYSGENFGDLTGTFRINLLLHSHIFNLLLQRLYTLMYQTPPFHH